MHNILHIKLLWTWRRKKWSHGNWVPNSGHREMSGMSIVYHSSFFPNEKKKLECGAYFFPLNLLGNDAEEATKLQR